eukprot:g1414.t1
MTASCLACLASLSKEDFCSDTKNQSITGCEKYVVKKRKKKKDVSQLISQAQEIWSGSYEKDIFEVETAAAAMCDGKASSDEFSSDKMNQYYLEEDVHWTEVEKLFCGGTNSKNRVPPITRTTLWNRETEVPYYPPKDSLLLCTDNNFAVLWKKDKIFVTSSSIDFDKLLKRDVNYLWIISAEKNILVSPQNVNKHTSGFGKLTEIKHSTTWNWTHRSYQPNERSFVKHADLAPATGCIFSNDDQTWKKERGFFRGKLRFAGELFSAGGRWVIDADSSFVYYREDGYFYKENSKDGNMMNSALLSDMLSSAKNLFLKNGSFNTWIETISFKKKELFPGNIHITSDEKDFLVSKFSRLWPSNYHFQCFKGCSCTVVDTIGTGIAGDVYRVRAAVDVSKIVDLQFKVNKLHVDIAMKVFSFTPLMNLHSNENLNDITLMQAKKNAQNAAIWESRVCLRLSRFSSSLKQDSGIARCLWQSAQMHLFSELYHGSDLEVWIRTGRLYCNNGDEKSVELRILSISIDIAKALYNLSLKGLVHLDVKPQNIFLETNEESKNNECDDNTVIIRMGDFGLSATEEQIMSDNFFAPRYPSAFASPEQHKSFKVNKSSDLFGLGLVILNMYSGGDIIWWTDEKSCVGDGTTKCGKNDESKWWSETQMKNIFDKLTKRKHIPDIPEKVKNLLSRCLKEEPSSRPTLREMIHVLNEVKSDVQMRGGKLLQNKFSSELEFKRAETFIVEAAALIQTNPASTTVTSSEDDEEAYRKARYNELHHAYELLRSSIDVSAKMKRKGKKEGNQKLWKKAKDIRLNALILLFRCHTELSTVALDNILFFKNAAKQSIQIAEKEHLNKFE